MHCSPLLINFKIMCKETFSYHECCCRFVSSYLESCRDPCPDDLTPEPHLVFLSERCAECQQTPSSERSSNQNQQLIAKGKSRALQHIATRWNERELALTRLNQYLRKEEKKCAQRDPTQVWLLYFRSMVKLHTRFADTETGPVYSAIAS